MAIEMTVRHIQVSQDAKDLLQRQAEDLLREFPNVENMHVILDGHGYRKSAEVVVQGKPHLRIEASAEADDVFEAAHEAFQRTLAQLRKALKKVQDHRPAEPVEGT